MNSPSLRILAFQHSCAPLAANQDTAARVLDAATAVLRAEPPAGVDLDYLDSFVRRHRAHLHGLVRSALERRTAGAA
ncbi:MAG: hypothetical protein GY898_16280 [Proteobacteria bacterium]|nr:hypothetical protein [Pseudomonadota bacterium]